MEDQTPNEEAPDISAESSEQVTRDGTSTFPREYVEELRTEAAQHRTRANELEERLVQSQRSLYRAQVAATGLLRDPNALPYSPELLDNPQALLEALEDFILENPLHAAIGGDVGQGRRGASPGADVSLSSLLSQL